MEKAGGRPLFRVWGEMNQLQQFSLIKSLVRLESQLAALEFPAYGNLYRRDSVTPQLHSEVPIDDEYCLGPMYNASWFPQPNNGIYAGPWKGLSELGLALTGRGLDRLQNSTFAPRGPHFGALSEHTEILEATKSIIPALVDWPIIQKLSKPTLWHTDLHMGNIYVSEEDPTTIVGIIDWQFTSIMPAFMQVQWPTFLEPPDNYEIGPVKPELPANFDVMDEDERAFAKTKNNQALVAKCYEASFAKHQSPAFQVLSRKYCPVRHLFLFCDNTTKNGIIPLRDSLTDIIGNWTEMGLGDTCPFRINDVDLSKHQQEFARYKDWQKLKGYTQELLHTDDDGWVSPQLDFDKVRAKHDELFQIYMELETKAISKSEAERLWFYVEQPNTTAQVLLEKEPSDPPR
ncbi:serine/threonine protein kinase [Aspergillus ibericus CBS 121593]|uniref:Altered inheritance of mitochondria protein 9, mitochondrial n=1 Tax=Aspergillus ibericus CBS 121593 TaxID=1448316 RepID=A0A395GJI8_9EURO|nr:serine/threonine protein kinase [Aspergillus ibericus CBS 121593]RAK95655.1 serine/threonine protein kinase [Aspergillus ibericus CBS 121593]